MISSSHYFQNSKRGSIPFITGLVGLNWLAFFALAAIPSIYTSESFAIAHLLLLGYLALTLFILRLGSIANLGEMPMLVYGVAYIAFHFGIVPVYFLAPEQLRALGFGLIWWYEDFSTVMRAYISAAVFLAGFCTALILPIRAAASPKEKGASRSALGKLPLVGLVIGVVVWIILVWNAGFGSYDLLLEMLAQSQRAELIGFVHSSIGLTFIFSVIAPSTRRWAIVVFSFWALLAFPTGLRGEVAFPAIIALSMLASQGLLRINMTRIVVGSLLFVALSSTVAVTRISTSNDTFLSSMSMSKGVAELGGSIRPSYEVMRWLENGDTLRLGETYYAPFERLFLRVFPLKERLPASQDTRLMNVLILDRAGPFGFSISAEAYYNFGNIGAAIVGFLAGVALRRFGRAYTLNYIPILPMLLVFSLFIHIRQDFVTAWASFIHGLAIIGPILVLKGIGKRWLK